MSGKCGELLFELRAEIVVLRPENSMGERGAPALDRVEGNGSPHVIGTLPFVAWPDVGVQEGVVVALDLEVDPAELRVTARADVLNRLREHLGAGEERVPARARQVGEPVHARGVGDEDAVAREELDVADNGEARLVPGKHGGVVAAEGGAYSVPLPVLGHGRTVCPVRLGPAWQD